MLTFVAIILTAIITALIVHRFEKKLRTNLIASHKAELIKETSKFHSSGFDSGREFAEKECSMMKTWIGSEEAKKYPCRHR